MQNRFYQPRSKKLVIIAENGIFSLRKAGFGNVKIRMKVYRDVTYNDHMQGFSVWELENPPRPPCQRGKRRRRCQRVVGQYPYIPLIMGIQEV